jgi:hypothetical protein
MNMPGDRNKSSIGKLLLLALVSSIFWACAAPLTDLASDYGQTKPTRIAVLPVFNDTPDMDAPVVFRLLALAELADRGYALIPPDQIDAALLTKGIQEAGMIESMTSQEIGELLNADALLYTRVMSYGRQVGVRIHMEGNFTLVETKTARKLWYAEMGVTDDMMLEGGIWMLTPNLLRGKDEKATKNSLVDPAGAYLAMRKARTEKAVAKFRAHPLRKEIFRIITIDKDKIPLLDEFFTKNFRTLPRR